jgi:hypothetical protein
MPTFSAEDIDIDPSEFLDSCDKSEIREIIEYLVEDGHIKKDRVISTPNSSVSVDEDLFEEHLNALHGRRHMLSNEEEETIIRIASKFRYL